MRAAWVAVTVASLSATAASAQDAQTPDPGDDHAATAPPAQTPSETPATRPEADRPARGSADAMAQRDAALVTGTASEDDHTPTTPATPPAGTRRVMFTSDARYDDVRAVRSSRSTGGTRTYTCDTPCQLDLPHGQYRLRFTHAGEDAQIHVGPYPMLVEASRGSVGELVVGVMTTIGGGIVLAIALLTGQGTCFTTESDCDIVHGPFALGAAAFAIAAGLFLMFDSQGGVEVTAMPL